MPAIRVPLALRLNRTIGGQHFQVAERALLLWNSERFLSLMLDHPAHRGVVLPILFPALFSNQEQHWHESIRNLSSRILERYAEVDPELVERCGAELEARLESDAHALQALQQAQQQRAGDGGDDAAAAAAAAGDAGGGGVDSGSSLVDALAGLSLAAAAAPSSSSSSSSGSASGDAAAAAHHATGRQDAAALDGSALAAGTPPLTPRTSLLGTAHVAGGGGAAAAGVAMGLHSSLATGHGHLSSSSSPPAGGGGAGVATAAAAAGGAAAAAGGVALGGGGAASSTGAGAAGSGAGVLLPHAGHGHLPHRAPAVRGTGAFSVQSDILPGASSRRDGGVGTPTKGGGDGHGGRPAFMSSLPLAGGEGDGGE